jgi:hypothetical protein
MTIRALIGTATLRLLAFLAVALATMASLRLPEQPAIVE